MTRRESDLPSPRSQLQRRLASLLSIRPLQVAAESAESSTCHLVGGALRDAALGREFRDLDLVIERDGLIFARRVAARLQARLIELGGDRFAAYRLIAVDLTLDIWDRQGGTLEADLARRDLTIHAFAVELSTGSVIDPFDGISDLEERVLRATSETSFASDPIRVLRLARFAGQLPSFTVDPRTLVLAIRSAADLERVSAPRIRVELERLLTSPAFLTAADLLLQLHLYPGLWQSQPGRDTPPYLRETVLSQLRHLDRLADETGGRVDRATARQAILLANLPTSTGPTAAEAVAKCRREGLLTRSEARRLDRLLSWQSLPRDDTDTRWFLHRSGEAWPTVACYLAARNEAAHPLSVYREQLDRLETLCRDSGDEIFDPDPLVTGTDLVSHVGLPAGRLLGEILASLRRLQIEGRLSSRSEALELARKLVSEHFDLED